MCGIAGLLRPGGADESLLSGTAKRMSDALAYRGPDSGGIWTHAAAGVAFDHLRLAIIDQMAKLAAPLDALDRMTLADSLGCLTDDILQKVDRAAVALETRVPFL